MFLFTQMFPKLRGDFYEPGWVFFQNFPIPVVDFSDQASVARHDQLVALVRTILQLTNSDPQLPQDKLRKQEAIVALDLTVNKLVIQLYNLNNEVRTIILEKY